MPGGDGGPERPRKRVFLIEDSALLRESLTATLEDLAPVEVVGTADSGRSACAWMDSRTQACDVAIVDVFLKSESGIDVLQHMTTYMRPPRRFVVTNYATDAVRRQCLALGAEAVFDKSTELEALVSRLWE